MFKLWTILLLLVIYSTELNGKPVDTEIGLNIDYDIKPVDGEIKFKEGRRHPNELESLNPDAQEDHEGKEGPMNKDNLGGNFDVSHFIPTVDNFNKKSQRLYQSNGFDKGSIANSEDISNKVSKLPENDQDEKLSSNQNVGKDESNRSQNSSNKLREFSETYAENKIPNDQNVGKNHGRNNKKENNNYYQNAPANTRAKNKLGENIQANSDNVPIPNDQIAEDQVSHGEAKDFMASSLKTTTGEFGEFTQNNPKNKIQNKQEPEDLGNEGVKVASANSVSEKFSDSKPNAINQVEINPDMKLSRQQNRAGDINTESDDYSDSPSDRWAQQKLGELILRDKLALDDTIQLRSQPAFKPKITRSKKLRDERRKLSFQNLPDDDIVKNKFENAERNGPFHKVDPERKSINEDKNREIKPTQNLPRPAADKNVHDYIQNAPTAKTRTSYFDDNQSKSHPVFINAAVKTFSQPTEDIDTKRLEDDQNWEARRPNQLDQEDEINSSSFKTKPTNFRTNVQNSGKVRGNEDDASSISPYQKDDVDINRPNADINDGRRPNKQMDPDVNAKHNSETRKNEEHNIEITQHNNIKYFEKKRPNKQSVSDTITEISRNPFTHKDEEDWTFSNNNTNGERRRPNFYGADVKTENADDTPISFPETSIKSKFIESTHNEIDFEKRGPNGSIIYPYQKEELDVKHPAENGGGRWTNKMNGADVDSEVDDKPSFPSQKLGKDPTIRDGALKITRSKNIERVSSNEDITHPDENGGLRTPNKLSGGDVNSEDDDKTQSLQTELRGNTKLDNRPDIHRPDTNNRPNNWNGGDLNSDNGDEFRSLSMEQRGNNILGDSGKRRPDKSAQNSKHNETGRRFNKLAAEDEYIPIQSLASKQRIEYNTKNRLIESEIPRINGQDGGYRSQNDVANMKRPHKNDEIIRINKLNGGDMNRDVGDQKQIFASENFGNDRLDEWNHKEDYSGKIRPIASSRDPLDHKTNVGKRPAERRRPIKLIGEDVNSSGGEDTYLSDQLGRASPVVLNKNQVNFRMKPLVEMIDTDRMHPYQKQGINFNPIDSKKVENRRTNKLSGVDVNTEDSDRQNFHSGISEVDSLKDSNQWKMGLGERNNDYQNRPKENENGMVKRPNKLNEDMNSEDENDTVKVYPTPNLNRKKPSSDFNDEEKRLLIKPPTNNNPANNDMLKSPEDIKQHRNKVLTYKKFEADEDSARGSFEKRPAYPQLELNTGGEDSDRIFSKNPKAKQNCTNKNCRLDINADYEK